MKKFIVVGTQRTGSSAIGEAIGLHPSITCGWEWTEMVPRHNKVMIGKEGLNGNFIKLLQADQEHMAKCFTIGAKWLGYRRLFGASNKWLFHPKYSLKLWLDLMEGHINWFRSSPDIHIIHIVRHDNIDWLKSKYVARETQSYVGKAYPLDIKVSVPVAEAIKRLRSKAWIDNRLSTLATSNPYIQLAYEDMGEGLDEMLSSVIRFLGCDPGMIPSDERVIKRQSNQSAENYISNYEELVSELGQLNLLAY